ncbi:MAG: hypothetical protein WC683_14140 [bacterium]
MPFDTYGSPGFSLDDCKVAVWSAGSTYGTEVDVYGVRILGGDPNFTEAVLEGDDAELAANSRLKSITVELEFADLSFDTLAVLTGITTATDSANYEAMLWDSVNAPYVGLCGRALQDGGDGDLHLFFPKGKLTSLSGIQLQQDNYVIPRATMRFIRDTTYGIFQPIKHNTATAIAIPPTYAQTS